MIWKTTRRTNKRFMQRETGGGHGVREISTERERQTETEKEAE